MLSWSSLPLLRVLELMLTSDEKDGRVPFAGAVLRLGGAHLGGYGESDIAYAYRQAQVDLF